MNLIQNISFKSQVRIKISHLRTISQCPHLETDKIGEGTGRQNAQGILSIPF